MLQRAKQEETVTIKEVLSVVFTSCCLCSARDDAYVW